MKRNDDGVNRTAALERWRGAARDQAREVADIVGYVESTPMETGRSSATRGAAQDFVDAITEFYFPDDMRREAARRSDAFAAHVREVEAAFGGGSVTTLAVMDFRRR